MESLIDLPNKSLFKADEVCSITGVKPYVLRFWEAEFAALGPILSASGHKLYEHKDIEIIFLIKKLLFEEKLTIEKAKLCFDDILRKKELNFQSAKSMVTESAGVESQHLSTLTEDELQKLVVAKQKLQTLVTWLEHS